MSWESVDCWFGSNVQKGTPHVSDKMKGRNTTTKKRRKYRRKYISFEIGREKKKKTGDMQIPKPKSQQKMKQEDVCKHGDIPVH